MAEDFGPPRPPGSERPPFARRGFEPPPLPNTDLSFIYATGEHEIKEMPDASPWAERYGASSRTRTEVVDTEPGQVWDNRWETFKPSWGREARPGTAEIFTYEGAKGGYVIADVVRLDKGHTEGLEPNITRTLIEMIVSAPGGKAKLLTAGT